MFSKHKPSPHSQKKTQCKSCFCNPNTKPCGVQLFTYDKNPSNKDTWFTDAVAEQNDQVERNVEFGCWLTNYNERRNKNIKICQYSFFDEHIVPPHFTEQNIDIIDKVRGMNKPYTRYNPFCK
jgi:hypothetical protein